jgi:prevent-host-death family protein
MAWALQDAKARFSELLDIVAAEGPQTVTRRGVETAVVVPIEQWKRLTASAPRPLLDVLLSPEPKGDFDRHIPTRRSRGLRLRPVDLE